METLYCVSLDSIPCLTTIRGGKSKMKYQFALSSDDAVLLAIMDKEIGCNIKIME